MDETDDVIGGKVDVTLLSYTGRDAGVRGVETGTGGGKNEVVFFGATKNV